MTTKIKGQFTVLNEKGMHTRPSTELVKVASHFKADISLSYKGCTVNAKSLLGILMLAAEKGAKITVSVEGADAERALETILKLAGGKFNASY
jgi:phosphocarrier protein